MGWNYLEKISVIDQLEKIQEELIKLKDYVPVFLFITNNSHEKRIKFLKENKLDKILERTNKSTQDYLEMDALYFNNKIDLYPHLDNNEEKIKFIIELNSMELTKFIDKNPDFQPISLINEYIEVYTRRWGYGFIIYYDRVLDPLCNFEELLKVQDSLIELNTYVPIFLYITKESLKLRINYLQKVKQENIMEEYRESLTYFYHSPLLGEAYVYFAIEMKYFLEEYHEFKKIINYESVEDYMKKENLIKHNPPVYIDDWALHKMPASLKDVYPIEDFYIK